MNFYNKKVFSYWRGGIDAVASLYCVFPARNLGIESKHYWRAELTSLRSATA